MYLMISSPHLIQTWHTANQNICSSYISMKKKSPHQPFHEPREIQQGVNISNA
jgi:hypothetical protein